MHVTEYSTPWKHLILDDLLDTDILGQVQDYVQNKYDLTTINRAVQENHISATAPLQQLLGPVVFDIKDRFFDQLNYANKKLPNRQYAFVQLAICPPGFKYKLVHTDHPVKLMTTVLYLMPEQGTGTELYSAEKKFHHEISWKPNRALCFVGQHKIEHQQTWHTYQNKCNISRVSVNLILSQTENGI
jgi:hypothetical protein